MTNQEYYNNCSDYFNNQKGQNYPCSNQIVTCAIFTDNQEKAIKIMKEHNAIVTRQSKNEIVWNINGERWIWKRTISDTCRGYRYYKVIIDKDFDYNIFHELIAPYCSFYCCSFEVI